MNNQVKVLIYWRFYFLFAMKQKLDIFLIILKRNLKIYLKYLDTFQMCLDNFLKGKSQPYVVN